MRPAIVAWLRRARTDSALALRGSAMLRALSPRAIEIPEVGEVRCVRPEDLYGWKLHGMVEFGHGQWRPKDLYDLDVLGELPLDREAVRVAIEAAFASRNEQLASLDDFLTRDGWGEGRSNRRRWRRFAETIVCDDFPVIRDRVRAAVRAFRENPESPEYAEYPE